MVRHGTVAGMVLIQRIKARVVADWHKLWSVWASAFGATLYGLVTAFPDTAMDLWKSLPQEIRGMVPHGPELSAILFAAVLILRLLKQKKTDG
jgi:hypothetical protein